MLSATTLKGEETFAFDPASNLLDPKAPRRPIHHPPPKLLDNLLRDYVGQHYTYDARGNLLERLDNGKKARFTWDLYDRLTRYEDDRLTADFAYDALGRRVAKYSKAHCPPSPGAGPAWIEQQQRTLNAQYDCGQNIYGWDGDTLAYETRYSDNPGERRLIHYFYEPGSFIPVAQTVENRNLSLVREPSHENGYHIDRDPLWQHQPVAKPFNAIAWYQCDHLGTPMELTDQRGEIAWSATYQAWGLAKEKRTDSATRENIRNPLRFQGQYFDTETGLHYNRYRYYDPQVGRFISKDPIGFVGGLNVYAYAPNPVGWVDPFGLAKSTTSGHSSHAKLGQEFHNNMEQYPYPQGYMRERKIGNAGRADALNPIECAIIERECTCSTRTIQRGKNQLQRYCDEMKKITGDDYAGILDILNPQTGKRSIDIVNPKP
ncbi:RHS repeat domain-containing protein [Pseudomonas helleri]|uniref:RHS repeat domain-containing protein n=2 Tax=Pseudomonas TaxID=286 RepID=UPI00129807D2|nr:RHS repeat-associated core domain-containing protein [Pseudomonas helleri]MQT29625.1 hypothetical protein [Pseudomonas helleri]